MVVAAFDDAGIRCVIDDATETLSRRVVAAHDKGIPIFVTVGPREASAATVTIRERNGQQAIRMLADAIEWLKRQESGGFAD